MSDQSASYGEITEYLKTVPAASLSWAQGFYSAGLSMVAISRVVATMAQDPDSPLRQAEEGMLSKEIVKLNQGMGVSEGNATANGKMPVKVKAVLSTADKVRVVRAVAGFAQPVFVATGMFKKNGHAVMNAVRRVLANYLVARVPVGASVIEVGPDVVNWMLSDTPRVWAGSRSGAYVGARPVLGPRDVVRVKWDVVAGLVLKHREGFFSADTVRKAEMLRDSYSSVFPDRKVQDVTAVGEYILSFDSNYDIKFSDMPVTMGACGARCWYGCMVRAKGLSRKTRVVSGKLDLLGAQYRVDWAAGRVDFRHPESEAFGYSHDVWEYMKYEEYNGYVWTTNTCHYVYSKGPETTDELLFFNVVRVPKLHRMYEPRFVENPFAGHLELTSVWAVGDEVNGMPTSFENVRFFVDELNFSKVLEKRRALDCKGNLAVTLSLVRSTNVRMWLHGTPVGTNKRIEARLAEATAVVVESLAAESRLNANFAFDVAMAQYDLSLPRSGWLRRMLEAVIDLKAVSGSVAGPIMRMWGDVRSCLIDKALSSVSQVKVSVRVVDRHIQLDRGFPGEVQGEHQPLYRSSCKCSEIADVEAALVLAKGKDRELLLKYRGDHLFKGVCAYCVPCYADKVDEAVVEEESFVDSGVSDCESEVVSDPYVGKSWRSEAACETVEAKAMLEFIELEQYLAKTQLVECRVDATRIFAHGPVSDTLVKEYCTSRTRHVVLEFLSGRCVRKYGAEVDVLGALYDMKRDAIVPIRAEGEVMFAHVPDGHYYSCGRLKVWNGLDLAAAVSYALDYGVVRPMRGSYSVVLGVPGAGKTYGMMKLLAEDVKQGRANDFLVLSITNASARAARKYGAEFGIATRLLDARVMTLDKYLLHSKFSAAVVCVDEFPMNHIAKVDAAVSISGAMDVRICGDARQIPYDPFCSEFEMKHATLAGSVDESSVVFLPETHRVAEDVCAMWLDQYPSIYPCACCGGDEKKRSTVSVERVTDVDMMRCEPGVRYHTYKQDERDELKSKLRMSGTVADLRAKTVGGLATVHEDQGSTHDHVVTVRLSTDYDKNASVRNPSLYNRERYVLTDTTRHKKSYVYKTMCAENDLVCKRVAMASDPWRLELVRKRQGMGKVSVVDML